MLKHNILFFQSSSLGGVYNEDPGLFELFLSNLKNSLDDDIYLKIPVIVPNQAMSSWVLDQITLSEGICANLELVNLIGPWLNNIYLANNKGVKFFDFKLARFIIYQYLSSNNDFGDDGEMLKEFIYPKGCHDLLRCFQLALSLEHIFEEYIYLRTEELLNLEASKIPRWQQQLIKYLLVQIGADKTFLDVYRFFAKEQTILLPKKLFIFALPNIYPSLLKIIKKIATQIPVYWYYKSTTPEYYGDLLSNKARATLESKLLKYPELNVEDLALLNANPLLANLAQQSREFIELLQANDITLYNFTNEKPTNSRTQTMLTQLQDDVRTMVYRIREELRYGSSKYFADPTSQCGNITTNNIFDLNDSSASIQINVCHNRMREVQVMFAQIVHILTNNPSVSYRDILITAPNINDYTSYIDAVFANEFVVNRQKEQLNVLVNISLITTKSIRVLDSLKMILNMPFHLPVNYFLQILNLAPLTLALKLDYTDIELVKKWLQDNSVYFGFDSNDYAIYGYDNYSAHSFKQFLKSLVLGACLSEDILLANEKLIYQNDKSAVVPYDNLDNNQLLLCNKLIELITLLEELRQTFYNGVNEYRNLSMTSVVAVLNKLKEIMIDDTSKPLIDDFIASLNQAKLEQVTLPVVIALLDEYMASFKTRINFDGRITCLSMQYARNLPYKYVYMLGLNFAEFPRVVNKNRLSILAKEWYLADRNQNADDKQTFLDIMLSCQRQLFISYIGNRETDNSEIKPSGVVSLLLNTLGQSFNDFKIEGQLNRYNYKNIIMRHCLHPFYNNHLAKYSKFWQMVGSISRNSDEQRYLDYNKLLASDLKQLYAKIYKDSDASGVLQAPLKDIGNMFLFTNCNLHRALQINSFALNDELLPDTENFRLHDFRLARLLYRYFSGYVGKVDEAELYEYLTLKGLLIYGEIGKLQFSYYRKLYQFYITSLGGTKISICTNLKLFDGEFTITDEVFFDDNGNVVITDNFENIADRQLVDQLEELPYHLKMDALLKYLLIYNSRQFTSMPKIIIKQLNSRQEHADFAIKVLNPEALWQEIGQAFRHSLVCPFIVHKKASEASAAALIATRHADGKYLSIFDYSNDKAWSRANAVYNNSFNNFELKRLKDELGMLATEYFTITHEQKMLNSVMVVGSILAQLERA